jgi:hypothetical protein
MEESLATKNNYSNEFINLDNNDLVDSIYKELIDLEIEFFAELENLFNNNNVMISDIENLKCIVKLKRKKLLEKLVLAIKNKSINRL